MNSGRRVKAATMAKLVDLIGANQIPPAQPHLEADLIMCHTMYCSSQHFIDLLLDRYNKTDEYDFGPRRKLSKTLRSLLLQLLADNPHSKAVEKIRDFAMENEAEDISSTLLSEIDLSRRDSGSRRTMWVRPLDDSAAPVLLVDRLAQVTGLTQVEPKELARQMTLLQAQAFQKLRTREYAYWMRSRLSMHDLIYRYKLRDPKIDRKMGNLVDVAAKFCGIVHWLRREIREASDGSAVLRYLFSFARELLRVNNLQALAAVVLVLSGHFSVLQSILTAEEVKELTEIVLLFHTSDNDTLEGTFHFSHSTRRHRDILFMAQSSVLPFVMPYLDGLQIINGNSTFVKEDELHTRMVSLQKMERASLVLQLVQQYQHRTYAFETVDNISSFIQRRLQQGLWSMALRPLRDLCREVVWEHRVDYKPHGLPQELAQFLDRSHLPMGDVLFVLNNL